MPEGLKKHFSHPDYTVGCGISPHRLPWEFAGCNCRWGIAPRPEAFNMYFPCTAHPLAVHCYIVAYCAEVRQYELALRALQRFCLWPVWGNVSGHGKNVDGAPEERRAALLRDASFASTCCAAGELRCCI